jgi:hypothetical protein
MQILSRLAIIQIATRHNGVYLIDIIALEKILNDNEWIEFFQQLLCTDKAIKIGIIRIKKLIY